MNAWLPQASYPCGNFSDTSNLKIREVKGSIGHAFTVCIHTENQNQVSFSPFGLQEISVLFELTVGHLRYCITDVPPQPNSPPDRVFREGPTNLRSSLMLEPVNRLLHHGVSKMAKRVVVLQDRVGSHLGYTSLVISQSQTRVKLNRVFFPR